MTLSGLLRRISLSRIAGVVLLAALLTLRVIDPIPVERLRLSAFDLFQQSFPRDLGQFPVAILDIDDASLTEIGQWPWPRTQIAELTEKAMQAGSVALAFDVLFSEPDRLSPALVAADNPNLPPDVRAELAAMPSNDLVLAETFRRSRVVAGQSSIRTTQTAQTDGEVPQVPHAMLGPDPSPFLLQFPELIQNLPELEEAASGRGVFTVLPDPDGVYRKVPLVMLVQGQIRLSIAPELLRIATGGDAFAVKSNEAGVDGIVVARKLIQTEADATVWPRYSVSDPNRFVSAADLLQDRVPPGRLQNHLVLVGTSAIGLEDFRATPLGIPMAGVEIHAQLLENILAGDLLLRPNTALAQELVWAASLCILVIFLAPILAARWLILSSILLIAGYGAFTFYLFLNANQIIDPTFPMLSTGLMVMLFSSANYLREELRRNQIRSAFGQYVSPALVSQLSKDPDNLKLGGENRELTVLFSDVRGFTSIAERFREDPQGLTQLMNRFLTVLSDAIMLSGGTIDKFMGDAVMAFWNAPLDDQGHAKSSCEAALRMLKAVDDLNETRRLRPRKKTVYEPINVGIGINTGECVVGNMGSDTRFDYTALGDAVNLASRLEGQTKTYGVSIVVGEATALAVQDSFALLELDLIRVKGKSLPERIFALFGDQKLAQNPMFLAVQAENGKMLDAYRTGQFEAAKDYISEVNHLAETLDIELSGYTEVYGDRLRRLMRDPPDDWDGVFVAETK
ncbi:CHASE2 domain-containing protein [Primorskyibacter sp. S87]|uniref:CHASE2 domain-containing protein n=1 Tax=Primorskyibacter sp. S87 TaxID=3415126 RepID=UPI003C7E5982